MQLLSLELSNRMAYLIPTMSFLILLNWFVRLLTLLRKLLPVSLSKTSYMNGTMWLPMVVLVTFRQVCLFTMEKIR